MADTLQSTWAGGPVQIPKTKVEDEARKAYAEGLNAADACPYPFHTEAALHWLATYNLCLPLTGEMEQSQQ